MSVEPQTVEEGEQAANNEAAYTIKLLREATERLDELEADDLEDVNDEMLAELRERVKQAEDTAEEARKDAIEEEMNERAEIGESLGHLTRVESHGKSVSDPDAVEQTLKAAGVDPDEAKEFKASKVAELAEEAGLDPEELVNKYTYDFWR